MKILNLLSLFAATSMYAKQAEFVKLQEVEPSIMVDLVFATGHQPIEDIPVIMYPAGTQCYICKEAAYALKAVQQEMKAYGLCLKVRDAYRPLWAQKRLWEEVKKLHLAHPEDYISDPVIEGGRHTRGTAVDLTLIDITTQQEIPLPPYRFSEVSHRDYAGPLLTEQQSKNRNFLRAVMMKHGFTTIRAEWWHFDYKGWQNYESLNLSFDEIKVAQ